MDELKIFSDVLINISPAIISIASLLALWQIIIAKDNIIVRSKREAVSLAADKCEKVARELLPMYTQAFLDPKKGCNLDCWELNNNKFSKDSLKDNAGGKKWVSDIRAKGDVLKVLDFLNEIESLSMYFSSGAADEKVACSVIGTVFCQWVEEFAPLLIELREGSVDDITSGPYQNTVRLYDIWSCRLSRGKLKEERDKLTVRLRAIEEKEIRPIGTGG
ncbi:MAG: hypothetical protein PHS46_01750 [Candidatus Omnitrophica bacterium]|nr:hypothetical protein [Candidatus Omnitrophota bacterium]